MHDFDLIQVPSSYPAPDHPVLQVQSAFYAQRPPTVWFVVGVATLTVFPNCSSSRPPLNHVLIYKFTLTESKYQSLRPLHMNLSRVSC